MSSSLEVSDVRVQSNSEGMTKTWKKVLVIVGGCVIFATLVAVVVVAVVLSIDDDDSSGSDPVPSSEQQRIDCYPEALGGVQVATEASCLERGCVWDPVDHEEPVPPCFVPQTAEFGFRLVSGPTDTELGYQWILEPINEFAIYGENFASVTFDVEFRRDHLLRFKVGMLQHSNPVELDISGPPE